MAFSDKTSRERVRHAWSEFSGVEVKPLVKEVVFENLPLEVAYAVDGVHVYVDIANTSTLVGDDGEAAHKRMLRFLHVLMRVAHLVFQRTDAVKVDLQNTRLHFLVYKPYDDAAQRVRVAVAVAQLLRDALNVGNALQTELANARVVVGVEAGVTLAVRNGTKGDREPLFLGNAANHAAKLTAAQASGVYLGPVAIGALKLQTVVGAPLPPDEIGRCVSEARLAVTVKDVAEAWTKELKSNAVGDVSFTTWRPPLSGVSLDELTYANSRRQELVVLYADIDGFTKYVATAIAGGAARDAVRLLHVIRKELRDVLNELGGKKVRYIGDCVQGLIAADTSARAVADALACAAAMRSAFTVIQQEIPIAKSLGIQIGLELGPSAVSRIGIQGSRDRVVVGRATLSAESEQGVCSGAETAIGPTACAVAPPPLREAFGPTRRCKDLDYNRYVALLAQSDESAADRLRVTSSGPAVIRPRAHAR